MIVYNIKIAPEGELSPNNIRIGRYRENEATQLRFDISSWKEVFGDNETQIVFLKPEQITPVQIYPTIEGNLAIWTITESDTDTVGTGCLEVQYIGQSGLLAKSAILQIEILETIDTIGPITCPCAMAEENREFFLRNVRGEYKNN